MPKRVALRPWSRFRFAYPQRRELPLWLNVSRAWGHFPLLYIPAVPLIVYLYRQGAGHRIE